MVYIKRKSEHKESAADDEEVINAEQSTEIGINCVVWAQVGRRWWPGVVKPRNEAPEIVGPYKPGHLLVYFTEDGGPHAWVRPSRLRPFVKDFGQFEKSQRSRLFVGAVYHAITLCENFSPEGWQVEEEDVIVVANDQEDNNNSVCEICSKPGILCCCDFCPRSYHFKCLDVKEKELPEGDWKCPVCKGEPLPAPPEPILEEQQQQLQAPPLDDNEGKKGRGRYNDEDEDEDEDEEFISEEEAEEDDDGSDFDYSHSRGKYKRNRSRRSTSTSKSEASSSRLAAAAAEASVLAKRHRSENGGGVVRNSSEHNTSVEGEAAGSSFSANNSNSNSNSNSNNNSNSNKNNISSIAISNDSSQRNNSSSSAKSPLPARSTQSANAPANGEQQTSSESVAAAKQEEAPPPENSEESQLKGLFLSNLPARCSERKLNDYLFSWGVCRRTSTRVRAERGFAFVDFATHEDCKKAKDLIENKCIEGNVLKVSYSKQREQPQSPSRRAPISNSRHDSNDRFQSDRNVDRSGYSDYPDSHKYDNSRQDSYRHDNYGNDYNREPRPAKLSEERRDSALSLLTTPTSNLKPGSSSNFSAAPQTTSAAPQTTSANPPQQESSNPADLNSILARLRQKMLEQTQDAGALAAGAGAGAVPLPRLPTPTAPDFEAGGMLGANIMPQPQQAWNPVAPGIGGLSVLSQIIPQANLASLDPHRIMAALTQQLQQQQQQQQQQQYSFGAQPFSSVYPPQQQQFIATHSLATPQAYSVYQPRNDFSNPTNIYTPQSTQQYSSYQVQQPNNNNNGNHSMVVDQPKPLRPVAQQPYHHHHHHDSTSHHHHHHLDSSGHHLDGANHHHHHDSSGHHRDAANHHHHHHASHHNSNRYPSHYTPQPR